MRLMGFEWKLSEGVEEHNMEILAQVSIQFARARRLAGTHALPRRAPPSPQHTHSQVVCSLKQEYSSPGQGTSLVVCSLE